MALKLYNSLGRKVQEFNPIKKNEVKIYSCGPTVWNYAHVGNFRTFVFEDILRRYLKFKGFRVFQVKNITDVEDRIIRGIKESGKPRQELTAFFEKAFMEDLDTLGIERVELYPRATENIPDMVKLVKSLMTKGYAYAAPDGSIYFDVSKFKNYGALSGVKVGSGKETGRISQDHYEEKAEATDFALWKAWDTDDGDVYWETELGKGRPGWHLECSAMSMKYLGQTFDIHTGGLDLKFPHHENEIAQSEADTGKRFVNYWLHSGFLAMKGKEMHKSVGNVVNLRELTKAGWDPKTIRLFLISSNYRDTIDLTDTALEQARAGRSRLTELISRLRSVDAKGTGSNQFAEAFLEDFEEAMDENLNTPKALSVIFALAKEVNTLIDSGSLSARDASDVVAALRKVDSVFGVLDFAEESLPPKAMELLEKREKARKERDFKESDRLREELLTMGILLEDTPTGTRWRKAE